ncbi:MAG: hypothetical protein IJQ82_02605 [Selenomonadaceae bacterium]|nr:hypothetical protein [Selenomonadaceae bacterium]
MIYNENETVERTDDKTDARKLAELLKDTHNAELLNNFVGVALSSYMNGVYDACQSFKAAQPA